MEREPCSLILCSRPGTKTVAKRFRCREKIGVPKDPTWCDPKAIRRSHALSGNAPIDVNLWYTSPRGQQCKVSVLCISYLCLFFSAFNLHLFLFFFVWLLQLQLRNRYLDVQIDKRMLVVSSPLGKSFSPHSVSSFIGPDEPHKSRWLNSNGRHLPRIFSVCQLIKRNFYELK